MTLASLASSKALLQCVCPLVLAGAAVKTVPPIRHAVHRLTASSPAPARPVAHHAASPAPIAAPCVPVSAGTTLALASPIEGLQSGMPTLDSAAFRSAPAALGGVAGFAVGAGAAPGGAPLLPAVPQFSGSAVPEASTWASLVVGFGVVGGAMRRGRSARGDVA